MKLFVKMLAPVAATLVVPATWASTIGVTGDPTLTIQWQNNAGGPVRDVGSVSFTVDDEGNFIASGVTGSTCTADAETGSVACTWGTGDEQDTININYAYGNLDPFVNFGYGVVDAGAASVFTVTFSSPIVPTITGVANYTLSLAGSFTNGTPNNGGSLAMAAPNTLGVLEGLLNLTTAVDGTGVGAGFAPGPPFSATYGPYGTSGTYDCSVLGGCTSLQARLSFLGSGGFDAYSFTGSFEVTDAVPVPAAVWLLGSALGVLGVLRRHAQ
jgi:hypothetical protein